MTHRNVFYVRTIWDEDAGVYCSESDIRGLHIEAETIGEFERLIHEHAADLIVANHLSMEDFARKPLCDLIPAYSLQFSPSDNEQLTT